MEQPTEETARTEPSISAVRAIAIGHLIVTGPVVAIMVGTMVICGLIWGWPNRWQLYLGAGFLMGWGWWSLSVPRWREWALRRGADPDRLQRLGVRTGLVWPKGWVFEKTEIRRRPK